MIDDRTLFIANAILHIVGLVSICCIIATWLMPQDESEDS